MRDGNEDDKIPDMGEDQRTGLSIGSALRRAREKRGLSLEEAEQATKIRARYLDALERQDYGILPASIYVHGFLKTYATFLGLDGEALSRELKESGQAKEEDETGPLPASRENPENSSEAGVRKPMPVARALSGGERRREGWLSGIGVPVLALAGVLLVALLGTVYFVGRGLPASDNQGRQTNHDNAGFVSRDRVSRNDAPVPKGTRKKKESAKKVAAPGNPGNTGSSKAASTSARPDPGPLEARIKIVGAESWIEVRTDGVISYSHLSQPGFSETFKAKRRLVVFTGNAGAVRVLLNGQNLGALGRDGEVLKKVYTVKNASPGQ